MSNQKPALRPFDDVGDLFTIEDWNQCVDSGCFINYDGFGKYATTDGFSDVRVWPSDRTREKLKPPSWATHVLWFNR